MSARAPTWSKTKNTTDYRSFLRAYLEESSWSLSDLARAAGFGRGFPGEVIAGKRRLTAKSYAAFENALKIPASGRKLFRYLVAREEREIFPGLDPGKIEAAIQELRTRSWTQTRRQITTRENPRTRALFDNPDVFAVYAAAGGSETGASYERIRSRTRLAESDLDRALFALIGAGLLTQDGNSYRPESTHVYLKSQNQEDCFARLFQAVSKRASERAPAGIQSDREFFFTSSFCVDEKKLPELKAALRKTVLQFVDDSIDTEGDRLVQMVTSFF